MFMGKNFCLKNDHVRYAAFYLQLRLVLEFKNYKYEMTSDKRILIVLQVYHKSNGKL